MNASTDNSALRNNLEEMTRESDVSRHPAMLKEITRKHPNSVVLLNSPQPIRRYTCGMHAFDFVGKPEYAAIALYGRGDVYVGGAFIGWLLARRLLVEVAQSDARVGDIVIYFDGETFKHIGRRVEGGRLISKWGTGHLYEHEVLEVPLSYGKNVRFFKRLSFEEAFKNFARFAEDNGVPRSVHLNAVRQRV